MDFGNLVTLSAKNSGGQRKTGKRGQSWNGFRHATRDVEGKTAFQFSDNMWDELGLETNGFLPAKDPETGRVLLIVFPDTDQNVLFFKNSTKGSEKSRNTKSTELEKILIEAGLMRKADPSEAGARKPVYQYLGFELTDNIPGSPDSVVATYIVTEDTDSGSASPEAEVPQANDIAAEAPVQEEAADAFDNAADDLDI